MRDPTDDQIAELLIGITGDGFNRSLGALEAAGAVATKKLRGRHYQGVGSKYYDILTEQIILTATYAAPALRRLFLEDGDATDAK